MISSQKFVFFVKCNYLMTEKRIKVQKGVFKTDQKSNKMKPETNAGMIRQICILQVKLSGVDCR